MKGADEPGRGGGIALEGADATCRTGGIAKDLEKGYPLDLSRGLGIALEAFEFAFDLPLDGGC